MMDMQEMRPREIFADEIAKGDSGGRRPGVAKPSENSSASYRPGFAKGRESLTQTSAAQHWSLRQIDDAIEEDLGVAAPGAVIEERW